MMNEIDDFLGPPQPARVWSFAQQAIFDDVARGRGHTVVVARAGSGKSTTIEEAVRRVPAGATIAVVAFGRDIAAEMRTRLSDVAVDVLTCHAYGFRQLGSKANGGVRPEVDKDRTIAIIKRTIVEAGLEKSLSYWGLAKLASLAKSYAVVPQLRGPWSLSSPENCAAAKKIREVVMVRHPDLEILTDESDPNWSALYDRAISIVISAISSCLNDWTVIDYDDQIYIPAVHPSIKLWKFDRVFVDETQDLNEAQVALCLRMLRPGGRIVAVGDDRQAIYGFRGAMDDGIDYIVRTLGAKRLALSTTYRCAKSIVAEARALVPDYEAGPNNPAGVVRSMQLDGLLPVLVPGDFVVSRSNAPLVKLLLGLFKDGRRAKMLGRDLGAELRNMVTRSQKRTVEDFLEWVDAWVAKTAKKRLKRNARASIEDLHDTRAALGAICEEIDTIAALLAKIDDMFVEETGGAVSPNRITLATTHKAKGLEADRVYCLRSTYRPALSLEEGNMLYVATTRAKNELVYVWDGPPGGAPFKGRRRPIQSLPAPRFNPGTHHNLEDLDDAEADAAPFGLTREDIGLPPEPPAPSPPILGCPHCLSGPMGPCICGEDDLPPYP
jgi:superfamily I DNA/RNA helicase